MHKVYPTLYWEFPVCWFQYISHGLCIFHDSHGFYCSNPRSVHKFQFFVWKLWLSLVSVLNFSIMVAYNQQNDMFVNKAHSMTLLKCHSKVWHSKPLRMCHLFVFSLNTCPSHPRHQLRGAIRGFPSSLIPPRRILHILFSPPSMLFHIRLSLAFHISIACSST